MWNKRTANVRDTVFVVGYFQFISLILDFNFRDLITAIS